MFFCMSTNWIVPVAADLSIILAQPVIDKAIEVGKVDASTTVADIMALVVARVRGVIKNNSRNQLSATVGSIPPESKQHVLILTAHQLIDSIPGMSATMSTSEEFGKLYTKAEDWLKEIKEGGNVTVPSDPDADLVGPAISDNYVDLSIDSSG